MDDLISRKAAIEAIHDIVFEKCIADEEADDESTYKEKSAMFKAHQDSLMAIIHIPSAPAVPLDKLCEWLADNADCPPGHSTLQSDCLKPDCKACWKTVVQEWMKGIR